MSNKNSAIFVLHVKSNHNIVMVSKIQPFPFFKANPSTMAVMWKFRRCRFHIKSNHNLVMLTEIQSFLFHVSFIKNVSCLMGIQPFPFSFVMSNKNSAVFIFHIKSNHNVVMLKEIQPSPFVMSNPTTTLSYLR